VRYVREFLGHINRLGDLVQRVYLEVA